VLHPYGRAGQTNPRRLTRAIEFLKIDAVPANGFQSVRAGMSRDKRLNNVARDPVISPGNESEGSSIERSTSNA
jgi:hypothetical protein